MSESPKQFDKDCEAVLLPRKLAERIRGIVNFEAWQGEIFRQLQAALSTPSHALQINAAPAGNTSQAPGRTREDTPGKAEGLGPEPGSLSGEPHPLRAPLIPAGAAPSTTPRTGEREPHLLPREDLEDEVLALRRELAEKSRDFEDAMRGAATLHEKLNSALSATPQSVLDAAAWRYRISDGEPWYYCGHNPKGDLPEGWIVEPLFRRADGGKQT